MLNAQLAGAQGNYKLCIELTSNFQSSCIILLTLHRNGK